jgi:glycogen debranching enzyme
MIGDMTGELTSEMLLRVYPELVFSYHQHTLLLLDRGGMIREGLHGLYEHDLRLLSRERLLVNGRPPQLDAFTLVAAHSSLGYYYCPAAMAVGSNDHEADRQIVLRVARFVGQGMYEEVEVTNHGLTAVHLQLAWQVATDFADLMEVRDGRHSPREGAAGRWQTASEGQGELAIDYPDTRLQRAVVLRWRVITRTDPRTEHGVPRADQAGTELHGPIWDGDRVAYSLILAPQDAVTISLTVAPVVNGELGTPSFGGDAFNETPGVPSTRRDSASSGWMASATRLEAANASVQRTWDRAIGDLAQLALGDGKTMPEHTVTAAGIPLYDTLFGRDALTVGGQSLLVSPRLAEGALRLLARHLGTKDDDFYDEQPGRVPQQVRDDPLALLGQNTFLHDYGDYAAPCAFLVLVGAHHLAAGDEDLTREFLEPAKRVLEWLDTRADLDGDGFLEYKTRSPLGQRHQGWKDSSNAVVYADGRQVEPPIAPCEIQGYWYAAKQVMAEVFFALGEPAHALELYRQAEDLKRRFNDRYWMKDQHYFAFALDADKQQVTSIVSNVGHCLATGIVDSKYAPDVVNHLLAPDLFSGWGIRTLSAAHPAYNPFSYHLGSVWPSENATIAIGMKRYGFGLEAGVLAKALFEAATLFEHHRLPETLGGHPRDARHPHPGIYPGACAPQAWSASAVVWLVQALLGLWTYAPLNAIIIDPELPEWLPELTLRDLRLKTARISLQFRRDASGKTDYRVVEQEGIIHVLRQPPPQARVGPVRRLHDLVESLLPGRS